MVDTVATAETNLTSSNISMIGYNSTVIVLHPLLVLVLHSNCAVWERDTTVVGGRPGASVLTMVLGFMLLLLAGCWAGGVEAKVVAASVMPHGESWPRGWG